MLEEDEGWIKCQIVGTDVWGHVPANYVQAVTRYQVDYSYEGNAEEGELTIKEGEVGVTLVRTLAYNLSIYPTAPNAIPCA